MSDEALLASLNGDRLLTSEELAPRLRTTPDALAVARCQRRPTPPYIKVGRKVLYSEKAVSEWLRSRTVNAGESR
jgi:hypothetical protein